MLKTEKTEWNAVKVFSATMARGRGQLGERVTEWISKNRVTPLDCVIRQSSDSEFHCISLIVFYDKNH